MATVTFTNVSKVFSDGTEAVRTLDLEIGDGELAVFVGPSGCGKTTALRMVAGLEDVTEGTIEIGGRVINDLNPRERDIAMIFQNYALYPQMSIRDNVGFPLRIKGVRKAAAAREGRVAWSGPWASRPNWVASPRSCPVVNGSAWPWAGQSSASPVCS